MKLLFELGKTGRRGTSIPKCYVLEHEISELIPKAYIRETKLNLPELSELQIIRHFTNLSKKNMGVDTNFYPLGSCTMKYNPKINEDIANLPGFKFIHPYESVEEVQGALEVL